MGCRSLTPLYRPLDYGLLSCIGRTSMDHVASFIKLAAKTDDIAKVRMELYTEILQADRTGRSLMEQGFSRSDVQYSMQILVKEGLVFKYGVGRNTYYTVTKREGNDKSYAKKLNPIVIPAQYVDNKALAFRMGFTDIKPAKGRVYRGALSVY